MNPKKRNNLFFIVVVVILLLIGLFAGYYFLFRPNYYIINLNDRNSVLPQKEEYSTENKDKAFTQATRSYVSSFKRALVQNAETIVVLSGEVAAISSTAQDIVYDQQSSKVNTVASVTLKNANRENRFFYTKNDLQNLSVRSGSKTTPGQAGLTTLKPGDKIQITETLNPLKSMEESRVRILIVKQ